MKTATKVFLILGLVSQSLFLIIYLLFGILISIFSINYFLIMMAFVIYIIAAIVVNSITLYRLSYSTKNQLIALGILCIFFMNLIAGILLLCITNKQLNNDKIENNNIQKEIPTKKEQIEDINIVEKLKQLKDLKEDEIITEEEFKNLKENLLKKIN